jgi:two-component system, NtrC family, sensor histidine kinase HydH
MLIKKAIKIRYVVFIFITIAALLLISAYFEISGSRQEMFDLLNEQANSIIQIVTTSGENNILASRELENLIIEKLYAVGDHFYYLDSIHHLTGTEIQNYIKLHDLAIVSIFTKSPQISYSSIPLVPELKDSMDRAVNYALQAEDNKIPIGIICDNIEPNYYFVSVKRAKETGGIILLGIDINYFKAFRKKIGIGKLIQRFGREKGIEYIALQDEYGITVASRNVKELSSITGDPFLIDVMKRDTSNSRITAYNEHDILEVAAPIFMGEEIKSILRIGLSLENLREIDKRMIRRIIIISIILIGIGIVVFSFILINQHYSSLQDEYRKMQSYTDNILDNMADGVIALDKYKNILFLNKNIEALFSVNINEMKGKELNLIIKSEEIENFINNRTGITDKEISIVRSDGSQLTVRLSLSYVYNTSDEVEIIIIVLQDITEEIKLNTQLRRNEKMVAMGELAAGVAHEVRNPLNSIAIITQRLQYEYEPKEDTEGFNKSINTIKNEIYRLNSIIEQFLKFARKPKLNLQKYNLIQLIDSILDLMREEAKLKQIELNFTYDSEPVLSIDPEQMKQALLNIIKNSFEAIETSGIINIRVSKNKDRYLIEVIDNGIGIPEENLSKLFNLYFTTKTTGSGIGLSMVNQIISEHNGRIEVESKTGQGTIFRIYI